MAKLQQIIRSNGTLSHSVNIPGEIIEELGWKKSDELELEASIFDGRDILKIVKCGQEVKNDTKI